MSDEVDKLIDKLLERLPIAEVLERFERRRRDDKKYGGLFSELTLPKKRGK